MEIVPVKKYFHGLREFNFVKLSLQMPSKKRKKMQSYRCESKNDEW